MKKRLNLKNGLSLTIDRNERVSTVTYAIYFAVGSIYESERNQGISHLVEHMFFRRLNHLSQEEFYFRTESMAGTVGGTTSTQYTRFELTVISDYAAEAFELMKEFFADFRWTFNELEAEKRVVCREIEQRGSGIDYLDRLQSGSAAFSRPIKGTIETVTALTLQEVNAWKRRFFSCDNACFVAVGNFDESVEHMIKDSLTAVKPTAERVPTRKQFRPKNAFSRRIETDRWLPSIDGDTADVSMVFDIDLAENDLVAVRVAYDAFCCGNGSKLSLMLRDTCGLIYDMDSCLEVYGSYGRLFVGWSVQDKRLFDSLDIFFEQIRAFKRGITAREYLSSVGFSTVNAVKYRDDTCGLARQYGYFDFICGIPFSIEESVLRKETLTAEEVNVAINSVFAPQNLFAYSAANRKHIRKKDLISRFEREIF